MPKINPTNLRWAREKAGLSLDEAAALIGLTGHGAVDRLAELESGLREPSRKQLLEMARRYRRPLLAFYLDQVPSPGARTPDFRTVVDPKPNAEASLAALVRDIRVRQALVRGALEDEDELAPLDFVGSVRADQGQAVLSEAISRILRLSRDDYRRQRNVNDAFALLRSRVEDAGVFVVLLGNLGHHTTNLSPEVFRGFSIADQVAPFIVINETDSRYAWSFTLLHEFCHILLGAGGISGYSSDVRVERLCDAAASSFLLDPAELRVIPAANNTPYEVLLAAIGDFAITRKLSRKMVAYNLFRFEHIGRDLYQRLAAQFDADRLEALTRQRGNGGPDYYVVRRHRIGASLINVINRMVNEGYLSSVKAAKVLGVKPTAVGRLTETF